MQDGERELHLRLDTRGARHTEARRVFDDVVQQRRLAYAGFSAYYQCPALPRPNSSDQPVEHVAFAAPAGQLCRASWEGGMCGHLPGIDVTTARDDERLLTRGIYDAKKEVACLS
jgi:hypothetical protein